MWILIECDDPVIGPGHDEKRRFILPDDFTLTMETISNSMPVTFQFGSEMHPCTPGEGGYHCPICHKDIPPIFPPITNGSLPGKIKIDKKDLDKLRELEEQ